MNFRLWSGRPRLRDLWLWITTRGWQRDWNALTDEDIDYLRRHNANFN